MLNKAETLSKKQIKQFWNNGYLIIKNAFDLDEIMQFRSYLNKKGVAVGKVSPDLLSDSYLSSFVCDDRILKTIRSLFDQDPVYFGDSGYKMYPNNVKPGNWHRDSVDRMGPGPDWDGRYSLVRFGIYLQDHTNQGGGLMIRKGSHNSICKNRKLEIFNEEVISQLNHRNHYLASSPGDLLVWSLRTTHAGPGRYIRGVRPRVAISKRMSNILPEWMQVQCKEDRYMISATFGVKSDHLYRYMDYIKQKSATQERRSISSYDKNAVKMLKQKGVHVIDIEN